MQLVAVTGKQESALVERPEPQAHGNLVVVKVTTTPMCTEYKLYKDGSPNEVLGHEAVGEVVSVAQPGRVKVGDRVVAMPLYSCGTCQLCISGDYIHCQNGRYVLRESGSATGTATYAQYLLKPDWMLLPIPDDVSDIHAGMACCGLGATFGAMQALNVDRFDTVLITGMGPVGLGGVINGTFRGARVIVVESHPYRQQLALELGAAAVFDPRDDTTSARIKELTNGIGVDKAIDCSGVAPAQRLLIDATRRRGAVAFVGEGGGLEIKISDDMIRKGLTLRGSWHWNMNDAPRMWATIRGSGDKIDKLVTHTFPLSHVQQAWDLQLTGNSGKVILHPWG
ncbi:MAG: Hypothetical zinc-type alcohol dehydrogenase-like protein YphC [uncultured Chloroflexia bacterium]|uniref:Hypothetical zinc-type alcohol dehydrogenase-like protein YphC n=1 Tax=uncultured Chloroflexia bacterium TaxID=1672391 RepID=A0A6J4K4S0_9CHLR|nr:MAG: Hypothetical zinc-type alcohol dehydrogenase-like protein YphC [uncultured Chloroflexia bacterium]